MSYYEKVLIFKGDVIMKKINEIKKEQKEKIEKAKKIAVAFGIGILVGYAAGTKDTLEKIFEDR